MYSICNDEYIDTHVMICTMIYVRQSLVIHILWYTYMIAYLIVYLRLNTIVYNKHHTNNKIATISINNNKKTNDNNNNNNRKHS